jgi:hypothetical protein
MSYRARRRWALFILVVGLPIYVVVAVNVVEMFDRPGILVELGVFVALGILWALPFRARRPRRSARSPRRSAFSARTTASWSRCSTIRRSRA